MLTSYNSVGIQDVDQKDMREVVEIAKLNAEIDDIVAREQILRDEITRIIAEIEVGS